MEQTRGEGLLRRSDDGDVVRCVEGESFCRFLTSVDPIGAAPLTQDLRASAWGIGRGVRVYGHLRGRAVAGQGGDFWPLAGDHVDVLAAYVEVDRDRFRVRGGRQWRTSGLGYHNFDGVAVTLRLFDPVRVDVWGGRSLLRGVSEPRTGAALAAIEPFAPDEGEILVGAEATWKPDAGRALSVLYQREIRRDRRGLYAERVAFDGFWRKGHLLVTGTAEADLATRKLNEVRLEGVYRPLPEMGAAAFVRRHRPYFEAWTIWGAFDPVGFDEAGARGWWSPSGLPLLLEARAARRAYEESHAATTFERFRDDGWRLSTAATLRPEGGWEGRLELATDVGFGAARDQASLRVGRTFRNDTRLGVSAMAFERVYEFRVDEGTVWGLGGDAETELREGVRLDGSVTAWIHRSAEGVPERDWSQLRGSLTVRWSLGSAAGGGS